MDVIFFKSFLPEIFLSISILLQLIFNVRFINNLKFNFPIIDKEAFSQTIFILLCLFVLFLKLKILGYSNNCVFINDENVRCLKIILSLVCIFSIMILIQIFSSEYLNFSEFFSLFLLALLSTYLILSSNDFIPFYLLIEMQSLCFYILTVFKRYSIVSAEAGVRYFVLGSFMSGILLFGILFIYAFFGSSNFSVIKIVSVLTSNLLTHCYVEQYNIIVNLGFFLITIFLLFKSGCIPFHIWIINTYDGAPTTSTVIFTLLPKLAIFCFLIRWVSSLGDFSINITEILFFLGIFTTLVGTFFTLFQKRFKIFLIYSSISQIGFLFVSLGINSVESVINCYFFLIIYLFSSILTWSYFCFHHFLQFNLDKYYFKRISSNLFFSHFSSIFKTTKFSIFIVLVLFSFAGIPPLAGFMAKFLVILSAISLNYFYESIFLILISSLSALNYVRLIKIFVFEVEEKLVKSFTIYHSQPYLLNNFIDSFFLIATICFFLLFFLFFYPSGLLLFCQYLIFSSQEI